MTTRYMGFVVTLSENIREDDAEDVIRALSMVKGVQSVKPVESSNHSDFIATQRAKTAMREKLFDIIQEMGT